MKIFEFFTFVYDWVFIIQLLTISLSLVLVFYPIKWEKRSVAIMLCHVLGAFAVGTVLNWLLFALSTVWTWLGGVHYPIAWLITILVYLCFFSKIYIPSRIIMGLTLFITVIAMTTLGREVMKVISFLGAANIAYYIAFVMIMLFSLLLRKYTLRNYSDIPTISVVLITVNAAVFAILVFYNTIVSMKNFFLANPQYCMLLVALYILSITGYLMVYFHCKANKEKLLLEIQNRLLKADQQVLAISEQAIDEMRTIRHDMKNQCQVMELMLKTEKYDELKKYFTSMNEQFLVESNGSFINCGNQLLNSIINMEVLKANSCGVRLLTKVNVSQELNIEPSDLCRVIVNLLDNAMEGVLRSNAGEYLVDCKIGLHADYLYICVQNAVREDTDKGALLKMNTEKEDATRHGFGHRIVKRIVEKYNGSISYRIEDSEFIAQAMLDLKAMK